jgi:hypothetical protein
MSHWQFHHLLTQRIGIAVGGRPAGACDGGLDPKSLSGICGSDGAACDSDRNSGTLIVE